MGRAIRRISREGAILAAALALAGIGAITAEETDPDFSLDNTVQAGPFHLAPFLFIKDFGYDDNIRLDAPESRGDYTVTVGPGVRGVVPLGRMAAWSFRDEIDYVVYAKEYKQNSVNNNLRTKLHVYLREVTPYIHVEQRNYRDRPNNEVDFLIRNITTRSRFGLTWSPFRRGSIDIYTDRYDYHFNPGSPEVPPGGDPDVTEQAAENLADSLERDEHYIGAQGRLRIRPRTSVLLDAQTGRIGFENIAAHDSTSATAMGGLEFDPSGPLRGYFKGGWKRIRPTEDSVDGFSGFVADGAVSLRVAGRGDLKANYARNTVFSVYGDNLYFLETVHGLAYEHFFSRRISAEIGRQMSDLDYPIAIPLYDPGLGAEVPRHRRDEITYDTLTLRYRLGPSMRVGLTMGHWDRDSTFEGLDRTRNTITTLLEYTP